VERILAEADERLKYQLRGTRIRENLVEFIDQVCEKKGINPKELQKMGSGRSCISQVRLQIAYQLVQDYGISLAEVARQLGVSTSAISKAITGRTKDKSS
jgi:DNA-binding MarR family transcriptional regulator